MTDDNEHLDQYPDGIFSRDVKVAGWLKLMYLILPFWGLFTFYLYWNGSQGWLDRGYWHELQEAANTTYPMINLNDPDIKQQMKENPEIDGHFR